jgi:hypothetical protein
VALENDCARAPSCDQRKLRMEQAGLAFDFKLGPNHPRRAQMIEVVARAHDLREQLGRRFTAGQLSRRELFARLHESFGEMAGGFAALLDDQEYETMFGMQKG